MAYNQILANRIREQLQELEGVEEKEMMGGLTFMLHDKMCVGVFKDEMMCRIDPAIFEEVIEISGCRAMDFTGKTMNGWILIDDSGMKNVAEFKKWIDMALDFNQYAKASKRPKR